MAQIAVALPVAPLLRAAGQRRQFLGAERLLRLHHAVRQAAVGQHRAEEGDMVLALDQQGGEVVDVEVAHHVGLVFDVDPDEERVRVARGQFLERGAVAAAGAAPQCAQASHGPAWAGQGCRDVGAVIGREGQAVHARIYSWADGRGAPDARILPRPAPSVLRMHVLV